MFLRCKVRRKDGKQHRYWSVVENTRVGGGRVVQRHVLYLGEINDTQELAWRRSIAVVEDGAGQPRTLSLFAEDRCEGLLADASIVGVIPRRVAARRLATAPEKRSAHFQSPCNSRRSCQVRRSLARRAARSPRQRSCRRAAWYRSAR